MPSIYPYKTGLYDGARRLNGADVDGPDIAVTRPTLSVALAKVQSEMHFQFTANVV